MKEKWYNSNWFIILMLIFLFPLGLVLMWYNRKWTKAARWIITGAIIIFAIIGFTTDDEEPAKKDTTASEKEKSKSGEDKKPHTEDKSKQANKEKKEKKTTKESLSPEKQLAKDIKSKVGKEHYQSTDFYNGKLIVNIRNYDGFSRKGMISNSNNAIVDVLKEIKKSKIEPQSVTINVMQDVTTGKLQDAQANFIHSEWDIKVINRINKDNEGLVMTDTKNYAESYRVNPNVK